MNKKIPQLYQPRDVLARKGGWQAVILPSAKSPKTGDLGVMCRAWMPVLTQPCPAKKIGSSFFLLVMGALSSRLLLCRRALAADFGSRAPQPATKQHGISPSALGRSRLLFQQLIFTIGDESRGQAGIKWSIPKVKGLRTGKGPECSYFPAAGT